MTIEQATLALIVITALGSAVIGGILFAFTAFLMRAFSQLPAPHGIAVMQRINVVILTPLFLSVFVGTGIGALLLGAHALAHWRAAGSGWLLGGAVLYAVGVIGITRAANIPRNDLLARVDPASAEGTRFWQRYLREWTAWNHVRTIAALAAALCFMLGM